MAPGSIPDDLLRYSRQVLLPWIGEKGQRRLSASRVMVMGVGALGTALGSSLVRAGVGFVRLVDRDFIELENLQRQSLFDEADISEGLPKAVAAARKLRRANGTVEVEPVVADVNSSNVEKLIDGCSLVLDGSDNIEVRLLVNDACLKHGVPWIYGAAIGTTGCTLTIVPGDGPCFRCLVPLLPAPGTIPTCETAGVLGSVPQAVAAMQVTEAIKLLTGRLDSLVRPLRFVDLWEGICETIEVTREPGRCPACDDGRYEYLQGTRRSGTKMCGRAAVQVDPGPVPAPEFPGLSRRLAAVGDVAFNEHMLRFRSRDIEIALFSDGRAIIKGPSDEGAARSIYARFIGV